MKTAIIYVSKHHGNTKKLAEAIAQKHEVTLIAAAAAPTPDLSGYELLGFASGVVCGKFYKQLRTVVESALPAGKKVFFLYTCGRNDKDFAADMKAVARAKGCAVLGAYGCSGWDTFGPLKLIGGANKGHPDAQELQAAVDFYDSLEGRAAE